MTATVTKFPNQFERFLRLHADTQGPLLTEAQLEQAFSSLPGNRTPRPDVITTVLTEAECDEIRAGFAQLGGADEVE